MGVALNGDSDVQTLHTSLFVGGLGSAGATLGTLRGWLVGRLAEKSFSGNGYILCIYIIYADGAYPHSILPIVS